MPRHKNKEQKPVLESKVSRSRPRTWLPKNRCMEAQILKVSTLRFSQVLVHIVIDIDLEDLILLFSILQYYNAEI